MLNFQMIFDYLRVLGINVNILGLMTDDAYPLFGCAIQKVFQQDQLSAIVNHNGRKLTSEQFTVKDMVLFGYNPNYHTIMVNCSAGISPAQQIHTLVHEYIHVLQWEFEFKEFAIPPNMVHNSIIWKQYCRFFGLEMETSDETKIIQGGRTYKTIVSLLS
jgi:hypothetical protein